MPELALVFLTLLFAVPTAFSVSRLLPAPAPQQWSTGNLRSIWIPALASASPVVLLVVLSSARFLISGSGVQGVSSLTRQRLATYSNLQNLVLASASSHQFADLDLASSIRSEMRRVEQEVTAADERDGQVPVDAYYQFALVAVNEGRFGDAARYFERIVQHRPNDYAAYTSLGVSYFFLAERQPRGSEAFKKYHEFAVKAHQRSVAIKKDYTKAYSNLSMSLYELGRKQEALATIDEAIRSDPNYPESYYNEACIYALEAEKAQTDSRNVDASRLRREALKWLGAAIDHGYQNYEEMRADASLNAIRGEARYKGLEHSLLETLRRGSSTQVNPTH